MRKTSPQTETKIVSMIIESKLSYQQMFDMTGVPVPTIKKIKARNLKTIQRAQELDITKLPIEAVKMVDMQILAELDKAIHNTTLLNQLIDSYKKGEISYRQYVKKKRGLGGLTVTQLITFATLAEKRLEVVLSK